MWGGNGAGGAEEFAHYNITRFPDDLFQWWAMDTLSGINHMHLALAYAHRDLKLSNILYKHDKFSGWVGKFWARAWGPGPGLGGRSHEGRDHRAGDPGPGRRGKKSEPGRREP